LGDLAQVREVRSVSDEAGVIECRQCGNLNLSMMAYCVRCSAPLDGEATVASREQSSQAQFADLDWRLVLGLLGSILLIFGVFTPLFSVPIVGSVTYLGNGSGDGLFILVFAVAAILLTLFKRFRYLFIPALLSLALMVYTFTSFQSRLGSLRNDENPFSSALGSAIQLSWGWGILTIGVVLLIVAASLKRMPA
jgi:hypothetical protein